MRRMMVGAVAVLALAGCKKDGGLKAQVAEERAAKEAAQADLQTCDGALADEAARAAACQAQLDPFLNPPTPDLKDRLLAIEGLEVEELPSPLPDHRVFALKLTQPLDHDDPAAGTFKQRMLLTHRDEAAPMVLYTTGYGLFGGPERWLGFLDEPTLLVQGNQLVLEHRYFEGSAPGHRDPAELDWRYLTVRQSAADSHQVVAHLRGIYGGRWLATGHSKGGMTAIFHQRHHPEDLAGIVPYVAPISFGRNDPRYEAHMAQIGPADGACRRRVEDLALAQIVRRAELSDALAAQDPRFKVLAPSVSAGLVALYAYSFAWSMWQYQGGEALCAVLPPDDAPADTLARWSSADPTALLGGGENELEAYGYQVAAELGGPSYNAPYLYFAYSQVDFSLFPPSSPPPWAEQAPTFDPAPMQAVDAFLRTEAQRVVAIYGAWDPWSAGQITVSEANGSRVFVAPAIGHAAAIADLAEADRAEATRMILEMAGIASFAPRWPSDSAIWPQARASRAWVTELYAGVERAGLRP
jgi:hypothetical protein